MKTTLLFIIFCLTGLVGLSQVSAGQIDNFENGTVQSWAEGGALTTSPNPPINIATGGPNGANDHFLRNVSSGGFGAGSKMVMFNQNQWAGNYITQNIVAIKFKAKVSTTSLNLRIAFDGTGGRICTTNAVSLNVGSSWVDVVIPIGSSNFTLVGGTNILQTLQNVSTMRILSSASPSWEGDSVAATLDIDVIEASTTLSYNNFEKIEFSLFPNPAKTFIQLKISNNQNINRIEVFDILGKQVLIGNSIEHKIDVSNLAKGLYILKVSSDNFYQTKPFLKS